jgi:hypothetical protein
VKFDPENIYELVMARDLTENAHFELQVVSSDKRVLERKREFYMNDAGQPIHEEFEFVAYTINDVFQLRVKDVNEVFQTFRIAEMPLVKKLVADITYEQARQEAKKDVTHFIQVGSKQLKLRFFLTINEELILKRTQEEIVRAGENPFLTKFKAQI